MAGAAWGIIHDPQPVDVAGGLRIQRETPGVSRGQRIE